MDGMGRRVLYFVFQPVSERPPCVTEILMLKDMGLDVAVLTRKCGGPVPEEFARRGIPCRFFEIRRHPVRPVQKVMNFFNYRKMFREFFGQYWTDDSVLWVGSEQSIIRLWPFLRGRHPIILNALEFYEEDWYQRPMRKIAPQMDVLTACEPHRAQYMKDWWHLTKTPYVLPNKPYSHPRKKNLEGSTPELVRAIDAVRGRKTLLYQGGIVADRDLSLLAAALAKGDSDYDLVLSGKTEGGQVEKLKKIYPRTRYLGNLPAPAHLELTSHATICVAFYKDNCINNRFCAPNKIYEYAGFGLPMLCNDIPGLTETVGRAGAAECVDFRDPDAILAAIRRIEENYSRYCEASERFYDATDNRAAVREIVEDAFRRTEAELT